MKWSLTLAVAAVLFSTQGAIAGDSATSPKQLFFHLSVCEGDPLGSVDAGTLTVISQPSVTTLEGQTFNVICGGRVLLDEKQDRIESVDVGLKVTGTASAIEDGKVRLDLEVSHSALAERTEKQVQVRTESTRTILRAPIGKVVKFRVGRADVRADRWIELLCEVVEPMTPHER